MQYLVEEKDGSFAVLSPEKMRKRLSNGQPIGAFYRLCKNTEPLPLLCWRLGNGIWMVTDVFRNMVEI